MQPPTGSPPPVVTRRYAQNAEYGADAANMAAAGWRVVNIQRGPDNAIIATYAPLTQLPPIQTPPQSTPPAETHMPMQSASMYVTPQEQQRAFRIGGAILVGLFGIPIVLLIVVGLIASLANGSRTTGGASGSLPSILGAQATDTAVAASYSATATAIANAPTPTPEPPPVLVSGARLGGPLSAFDTKYGPEASQGTWNTTIAGQKAQLTVTITNAGDSLDDQDRVIIIDILGQGGATWNTANDVAIVAPFLPRDATHIHNISGTGSLGIDHIYMSQQLANSIDSGVFQDSANQPLAPGTFDWQCSTSHPLCEVAVGTNS